MPRTSPTSRPRMACGRPAGRPAGVSYRCQRVNSLPVTRLWIDKVTLYVKGQKAVRAGRVMGRGSITDRTASQRSGAT